MRRHTHAGAARMRAHEAPPTTTYLDAGTPANAALAEIALCENLGDGDELVRLIGDLAESPMFVLLANEFLHGHTRAQGETEIAYRETALVRSAAPRRTLLPGGKGRGAGGMKKWKLWVVYIYMDEKWTPAYAGGRVLGFAKRNDAWTSAREWCQKPYWTKTLPMVLSEKAAVEAKHDRKTTYADRAVPRTECLWLNAAAAERSQRQGSLMGCGVVEVALG